MYGDDARAGQRGFSGTRNAKRPVHLGLGLQGLALPVTGTGGKRGTVQGCHAGSLIGPAEKEKDQAAGNGRPAKQRVKYERRRKEKRGPRQVEQRQNGGLGPEPDHSARIALYGKGRHILRGKRQAAEGSLQHAGIHSGLQPRADAGDDPAAGVVKNPISRNRNPARSDRTTRVSSGHEARTLS